MYPPFTGPKRRKTDQNLIFYLDKENQLLHKIAEWKSGGAPKQVAFTPNGSELWVTQLVGDGVEIFKPQTGELLGFVDLPDGGSVEIIFNFTPWIANSPPSMCGVVRF